VPVVEVLRGAIGEIEDYARVDLITSPRDLVPGAAVTDVTHLLAELIENAALYSPPSTRVQVTASRVASGLAVEIEDRGLGIPPGTLATLNDRLAKPPEFDLADSDRLGLFVVSLLAARHGIKITLRGSPYGGISAVVLMPHRLVLEGDPASLPSAAAEPAAVGRPEGDRGSAGEAGTGHRLGAKPTASSVSSKMTGGQARLPARPELSDTAADPLVPRAPRETASSGSRPPAVAGMHRGLPRRVRQASLAPQLRDAPAAGGSGGGGAHDAGSAERTRALIASIQHGWRSGRRDVGRAADGTAEQPGDTGPGPGYGSAER
jgi:Histidine kinase-, DNA gyrase B-, and HSP90-like ATPase